jgi:hypothetical protein
MWAVCPLNAQNTALPADHARKTMGTRADGWIKITIDTHLLRSDALMDQF